MASSDKGFLFFYDWLEPFSTLSGDDFKRLFLAMVEYQKNDVEPPEFQGKAKFLAMFVFPQLQRRKISSKAGKSGMSRRWQNDVNNDVNNTVNNSDNKHVTTQDQDQNKDKNIDIDKTTPRASETASERRARSAPPQKKKVKEITRGEKSYDLEDFFQAALERALE